MRSAPDVPFGNSGANTNPCDNVPCEADKNFLLPVNERDSRSKEAGGMCESFLIDARCASSQPSKKDFFMPRIATKICVLKYKSKETALQKKSGPSSFFFSSTLWFLKNKTFFWTNEMARVILIHLQNAEVLYFFYKKSRTTRPALR